MNKIKSVIDNLQINEKRLRLIEGRSQRLSLRREMSDLTFHIEVARYANLVDQIRNGILDEKDVVDRLNNLRQDENVVRYIDLEDQCRLLDEEESDYHRTIQIDLREGLGYIGVPNIFIFQRYLTPDRSLKLALHIILDRGFQAYKETPDTIIMPEEPVFSNRKLRHFYAKTSYRYLEQLTRDESFDIKTKKLGSIRIQENR